MFDAGLDTDASGTIDVGEALVGLSSLSPFYIANSVTTATNSGDLSGLIAGYNTAGVDADATDYYDVTDGTAGDVDAAIVDVARLSNLTTLQSDSYTVYLIVQAWDGFGTPQARIVNQERVAFIVDRSGIYPAGHGIPGLPGEVGYADADELLDALEDHADHAG